MYYNCTKETKEKEKGTLLGFLALWGSLCLEVIWRIAGHDLH